MKSSLFLSAAFVGLLAAQPVLAEDGPGGVMIVLDSSGSMWGQIDGETKRDIARTALREMLGDLPKDADVGLIAYGHRRKGDCGDIELISTPKSGAAGAVADAADKLRPVGKTPLSAAVREAAQALKFEERKASVVLITDGIETCNLDPCAVGAELEELGVDFTAHVVGFGLSRTEGRQIACLAEATGGRYLQAADAGELGEALKDVTVAVSEDTPTQAADSGDAAATLAFDPPVAIGSGFTVRWTGPGKNDDYLEIVRPDGDGVIGGVSYGDVQRPDGAPAEGEVSGEARVRAPKEPGEYRLRYVWTPAGGSEVIAEIPLPVVDAEVAVFPPEIAGAGATFPVDWKGPANEGDYIDIVPVGFTNTAGETAYDYVEAGEPASLVAPVEPGAYEVRYVAEASDGRRVMASVPIAIEETDVELAVPASVMGGEPIPVDWAGPNTEGDYIDLVTAGFEATSGEVSYAYTANGSPAVLKAPLAAGAFEVRYVLEGAGGRKVQAVAPIEVTAPVATVSAPGEVVIGSEIAVVWTGPKGTGHYVDLAPVGTEEASGEVTYAYTEYGSPAIMTAPGEPGDYEIRFVGQGADFYDRKVLARRPIRISAGD